MGVCVSGSSGGRKYLGQKCLPRLSLPHGCTARRHTTNEQPLRESDTAARDQSQAADQPRGVLVVYIYYPQKIPPPEASDRPARAMRLRPSSRTWLRAVTFSPFEVPRRPPPPSSSRTIPVDWLGL
jgi:hypothetical protein